LFYIASMGLHFVGFGDLIDFIPSFFFQLQNDFWSVEVSSFVFYSYLIFSLLATLKKEIFYLFSIYSFVLFLSYYL
ncbi:MAG: hypothetical protein OIF32_09930, partial [Campylobacterales bacterium]|nr:hypothetical protein [Campylobacterales bacterium]